MYKDETLGADYDVIDIPASEADAAKHAREQLIEALGEVDDAIMEKYVHGEPISAEELASQPPARYHRHEGVPGGLRLGLQE